VAVIGVAIDQVLFGPLSGADRLRVEIPNLRRAFDHALASSDVERAGSLIVPFAALRSFIDWRIHGWADEVLALPGAAGSPHEAELLALRSVDAWLDNRFGELRSIADDMMHAAEQSVPALVQHPPERHCRQPFARRRRADARTRRRVRRLLADSLVRHMVALLPSNPDAPTVELDDLRDDVAALSASVSELERGKRGVPLGDVGVHAG
jgi:hypothetical protein